MRRSEGLLADNGALVAYTGKYTGRSPKDKFTVKDPVTAELVNWGYVNQPFDPEKFDALYDRVVALFAVNVVLTTIGVRFGTGM